MTETHAAILIILGLACTSPAFASNDAPLDDGYLESGKVASKPFAMSRFGPSADAVQAASPFAGRLRIASGLELQVDIITDQFGILGRTRRHFAGPAARSTSTLVHGDGDAAADRCARRLPNTVISPWEWIIVARPRPACRRTVKSDRADDAVCARWSSNADCTHYGVLTLPLD
ncbi:MAG: hypothetical protein U5K38_04895 [Woeseiaceae bacterium]|nr:hypothetical protein [Woeseiaceae bacterium]